MLITLAICAGTAVGLTAALDLTSEEGRGWLDRVPRGLLWLAARRVPEELRAATYRDEWLPELEYIAQAYKDRPISRLVQGVRFAGGLLVSARRIARDKAPVTVPPSSQVDPRTTVSRLVNRSAATNAEQIAMFLLALIVMWMSDHTLPWYVKVAATLLALALLAVLRTVHTRPQPEPRSA